MNILTITTFRRAERRAVPSRPAVPARDRSAYSTNEWTTDSGWTITSIWSARNPNSQRASITSSALFISVAESTVIFGPMRQVG